jgi:hypothetical protein
MMLHAPSPLRRLPQIAALLVLLAWASGSRAEPVVSETPTLTGVYVGGRAGTPDRDVTVDLRDGRLVLVDDARVEVVSLGPMTATADGMARWKASWKPLASFGPRRKGTPTAMGPGQLELARGPSGALSLCFVSARATRSAPSLTVTPPPGARHGVTCYDLVPLRAALTPDFECMRECRQQHMMRAVSAEQIEADCVSQCTR